MNFPPKKHYKSDRKQVDILEQVKPPGNQKKTARRYIKRAIRQAAEADEEKNKRENIEST